MGNQSNRAVVLYLGAGDDRVDRSAGAEDSQPVAADDGFHQGDLFGAFCLLRCGRNSGRFGGRTGRFPGRSHPVCPERLAFPEENRRRRRQAPLDDDMVLWGRGLSFLPDVPVGDPSDRPDFSVSGCHHTKSSPCAIRFGGNAGECDPAEHILKNKNAIAGAVAFFSDDYGRNGAYVYNPFTF